MKSVAYFQRICVGVIVIVVGALLGSCGINAENTLTPTASKIVPTEVVRPSATFMLEPSQTPEPTKTEQSPKQLSEQERKAIIAEMVRTNNHCVLPCFIGVEIQHSTLDNIEALFTPSMGPGLITRDQITNETFYGSGFETGNLILGSFEIHLSDGRTDGIHLHLGGLWRPEVSFEDWEPYTLKGVLSQLGPPTRILFNKQGPPSESSDQGMIVHYSLIYETIDTIIAYHGSKTDDVRQYHFCPMQQKPEFIGISIGSYTKDITVSGTDLEEASTYTVKDFYNLDWSNPDTCIDLDTSVLLSHP